MVRFVLERAAQAGLDPDRLARLAGVPNWREGGEATRVSHRHCLRLWELMEQETGDPEIALRASDRSTVGELGMLEYLFLSAATLGEALDACAGNSGCLTTSYSVRISDRSAPEVDIELLTPTEDGRGRELMVHAAFALLIDRARWATRYPVIPTKVTFRQLTSAAPGPFVELFGTATIDFASATDSITLRATDLELPMKTADPDLSAVLRGYASTLPATPEFAETWIDRLAIVLDTALAEGAATLEVVARRMLLSPRSLQRRLSESGTTWRRELDRARQRRLENAAHLPRARQAEFLGYSDPAALRRAVNRWRGRDRS